MNYDIRVRAWNHLGVKSSFQTISGYTVGSPGAGATSTRDYRFVTEIPHITSFERGSVVDVVTKTIDNGTVA